MSGILHLGTSLIESTESLVHKCLYAASMLTLPLRRNNAFGKRVFCSWFHFGIVCFQVWTTGEVAI